MTLEQLKMEKYRQVNRGLRRRNKIMNQEEIDRQDKINTIIQLTGLTQFVIVVACLVFEMLTAIKIINFKVLCISGAIVTLGFLITRRK